MYNIKPIEEYTPYQQDFIKKDTIATCVLDTSMHKCFVDCELWNKCWGDLEKEWNDKKLKNEG